MHKRILRPAKNLNNRVASKFHRIEKKLAEARKSRQGRNIFKEWYTIREVCDDFGFSTKWLHIVEDHVGMRVRRRRNGHRIYTPDQYDYFERLSAYRGLHASDLTMIIHLMQE